MRTGWQRIGVIVSIVIVIFGTASAFAGRAETKIASAEYFREKCASRHLRYPSSKGDDDLYRKCWDDSAADAASLSDMIFYKSLINRTLGPTLALWVFGYILIRSIKWVRAGFARTGEGG